MTVSYPWLLCSFVGTVREFKDYLEALNNKPLFLFDVTYQELVSVYHGRPQSSE